MPYGYDTVIEREIDMLIENHHSMSEYKSSYRCFKDEVEDILQVLVLYGSDRDLNHVSLMGREDAEDILRDVIGIPSYVTHLGFHNWKQASMLLQALLRMGKGVAPRIMIMSVVRMIRRYGEEPHDGLHDRLILGNICVSVESKVGRHVTLHGSFLDLVLVLSKGRQLSIRTEGTDVISACTSNILGLDIDKCEPGNDCIICCDSQYLTEDRIESVLEGMHRGRRLIIITDPGFLSDASADSRRPISDLRVISVEPYHDPGSPSQFLIIVIKKNKRKKGDPELSANPLRTVTDDSTGDDTDRPEDAEGDGLERISIGDIATIRRGIAIPKTELKEGPGLDLPVYVRPQDVEYGAIDLSNSSFVTKKTSLIEPGSILVSTYDPSNVNCIIRKDGLDYVASARFGIIQMDGGYDPEYVLAYLRSSMFKRDSKRIRRGEYGCLDLEGMGMISIPIASSEEQIAIIKRLSKISDPDPETITQVFRDCLEKEPEN